METHLTCINFITVAALWFNTWLLAIGLQLIYQFYNKPLFYSNVFNLMDVPSSDQPFHSPASFNVIAIADIHFAYISCC